MNLPGSEQVYGNSECSNDREDATRMAASLAMLELFSDSGDTKRCISAMPPALAKMALQASIAKPVATKPKVRGSNDSLHATAISAMPSVSSETGPQACSN